MRVNNAERVTITEDIVERFWASVAPPDKNGCRLWLGGVVVHPDDPGRRYGKLKAARVYVTAHALAYKIAKGSITPGLFVCHVAEVCKSKLCVEPTHLYLGTNADNMRDRILDGTNAARHRKKHRRVTPEEVRLMRKMYLTGLHTVLGLARQFDVSHRLAWGILRNEYHHDPEYHPPVFTRSQAVACGCRNRRKKPLTS